MIHLPRRYAGAAALLRPPPSRLSTVVAGPAKEQAVLPWYRRAATSTTYDLTLRWHKAVRVAGRTGTGICGGDVLTFCALHTTCVAGSRHTIGGATTACSRLGVATFRRTCGTATTWCLPAILGFYILRGIDLVMTNGHGSPNERQACCPTPFRNTPSKVTTLYAPKAYRLSCSNSPPTPYAA